MTFLPSVFSVSPLSADKLAVSVIGELTLRRSYDSSYTVHLLFACAAFHGWIGWKAARYHSLSSTSMASSHELSSPEASWHTESEASADDDMEFEVSRDKAATPALSMWSSMISRRD